MPDTPTFGSKIYGRVQHEAPLRSWRRRLRAALAYRDVGVAYLQARHFVQSRRTNGSHDGNAAARLRPAHRRFRQHTDPKAVGRALGLEAQNHVR